MKKFKITLSISICVLLLFPFGEAGMGFSFAGQVVLNGASMVISGGSVATPVYLVIDNAATTGIIWNSGSIISENEYNCVKWNIQTTTGTYMVPFGTSTGTNIPLTLNIGTGGTGSGNMVFATYQGGTWDNSIYMPSDVTHMAAMSGPANNSDFVIDRFWIIDALGYTTKPTPTITFTYLDGEWSAPGNTISEPGLFAQRFNPAPNNLWGDWLGPIGTANTIANTVSSGSVAPADFFRSWTLVDNSSPLPISLLYFKARWKDQKYTSVLLEWETASEINNDFFEIQRSSNAINFTSIKIVQGAGNSNQVISYTDYDYEPDKHATTYYRLRQVDYDGSYTYSNIEAVNPPQEIDLIIIYPNPASEFIDFLVYSSKDVEVSVWVFDAAAKLVISETIKLKKGVNKQQLNTSHLSSGSYVLQVTANENTKTEKQFVIR